MLIMLGVWFVVVMRFCVVFVSVVVLRLLWFLSCIVKLFVLLRFCIGGGIVMMIDVLVMVVSCLCILVVIVLIVRLCVLCFG